MWLFQLGPAHSVALRKLADDLTFLKGLVRIKRIAQKVRMPSDDFTLPQLGAGGAGAKVGDLIQHFLFSMLGGFH